MQLVMRRTRHNLRPMDSNGAYLAWKALKRMLLVKTASALWSVHILENTQFLQRTSTFKSTKCFLTLTELSLSYSRRTIKARRNALKGPIKTWKTCRLMQLSSMNAFANPPASNRKASWPISEPTLLWTVVKTIKQCNYSFTMTKTQHRTVILQMLPRTRTCQLKPFTTSLVFQSAKPMSSLSKTPCTRSVGRCTLNSTSTT